MGTPTAKAVQGVFVAPRAVRAVIFALFSFAILSLPAPVSAQYVEVEVPPDSGSAPSARFVFPPDRSVLASEIVIAIEASDTAGVLSPTRLYIARAETDPAHLGHLIGRGHRHRRRGGRHDDDAQVTETISGPGESVLIEQDFDTRSVPDGQYRLSGVITNVYGHSSLITETIEVDNRAPRVRIDRFGGDRGSRGREDGDEDDDDEDERDRRGERLLVVTESVDISGSVNDRNLTSWSLVAKIGTETIATLGSGTSELRHEHLGTYKASMAPPGYAGPVDLVLTATDSAIPAPNVAQTSRRIFSDYYLDAYGRLDLAASYEVSTTIPVIASVTGDVSNWRLDVFRESNTDPLITRTGTETGEALHLADFNVRDTYGPGTYIFELTVTDADGDMGIDRRVVSFIWRPAYLAITYVGPPISGPGPTTPLSEFTDPTVSGVVEVRGEVSGSNTWAWGLGRPITLGEPSFAGDKIIFSSNIDDVWNFDIYQVDIDGSDLIRLTTNPGFDYAPKFSGGGARIVFSSTRDYPSHPAGTDIYVMGANGTNIERLTTDGQSSYPTFSPSATHVAFSRPGGIFELELSTGATEQITSGDDGFPDYSPDGRYLAFDGGIRGNQQIYVADLAQPGYPITQLTSAPVFAGEPAYSPDGTRIAYWHNYEIWVADADGANARSLGVLGADPTWTPDGARIAYSHVPIVGPNKIYLIGSDPNNPGNPEELVIPGSSRVPDISSPQLPFPPSPAKNPGEYTPIDIASFVKSPDPLEHWGYLRAPPDQLPQGERGPDSILGYIDTSRLPAGVTSLSLSALQCETPPESPFAYRLEIPPDAETQATIAAIGQCNAYSTPQVPLRVLPQSASVDLRIDAGRQGPGYAGALADTKTYSATGIWLEGDRWAFSAPPHDGLVVPGLVRSDGQMWGSGQPASDGPTYVPVGDLAAFEDLDLVIGDPALGLKVLAGAEIVPTPVACDETYVPGRTGCRYEVDISPGHLGGATHVTAFSDDLAGLLGAIKWSYTTTRPGPNAALPGPGGWGGAVGATQTTDVRLIFSGYGRDTALIVPDLGGGG